MIGRMRISSINNVSSSSAFRWLLPFVIVVMTTILQKYGVIVNVGTVVRADDNNENNNNNNNNAYNNDYTNYYNGNDDGTCMIYDKNDFFTVAVQLTLAFAAIASLYIKRLQEIPQRTIITWFYDVSKQGFGACYAHVMNMIIAAIISDNIRGENVLEDQCAWYGLSYLIDTTIGLLLAILGLQAVERIANRYQYKPLQHSGVYVGDTALYHWCIQVVSWIFILTITKCIIYIFMWIFSSQLASIGTILFAPFNGYKHIELLFVMIFFPGILNIIYFWIADSFLKATNDQTEAFTHDESGLQDKKESLLSKEEEEEQQPPKDTEMTTTTGTTLPTWSALSPTETKTTI